MKTRTAQEWAEILGKLGVRVSTASKWAPIFAKVIGPDTFSKDEGELDEFLGHALHESDMLEKLEESLYYKTPGLLMQTWRTRFKSLADERPYLRNPEALANKVYGGRMGNVNPGDGWRHRGSGLMQITGANNLKAVQAATGIPVYDNPELLRQPTEECLRVCIAWWEKNIPDVILDDEEITTETKLVNGGTIGLAHREKMTRKVREVLA